MGEDDIRAVSDTILCCCARKGKHGGNRVTVAFGRRIWPLILMPWLLAGQPPAITQEGVRNLASQMPPSLPGGALAPGALISIRGLRLSARDQAPRIVFRQSGSELAAEAIKSTTEYLETRVPSKLVAGNADLIVIREGQASRPFLVHIRPGAFGIFSENGKGWGPGGPEAHPAGSAAISGTGLGAYPGAEVWVGGKQASQVSVSPHPKRAGTDEVRFKLASDTPFGCFVPVMVKTGASVSNVVTIPVAAPGQPCPGSPMSPDGLIVLARLMMRVRLVGGAPADFTQDIGAAIFPNSPGSPLFVGWRQLPPPRTCTSYSGNWISDSSSGGVVDFLFRAEGPGKSAGPSITVAGPKGSASLLPREGGRGFYAAELGGGLPFTRIPKPRFLTEGLFHISGGGDQIAPFTADAKFPAAVKWRDPDKLDFIDRAAGAIVRWSGGSSHEQVLLLAINVDQLSGGMGMCLCVAPAADRHMQIPPAMLANVPASQPIPGIPMSYYFIAALPAVPQRFQTGGVQHGALLLTTLQGRTVTFR